VVLHIRSLQSMVFESRVIIIPPNTAFPVIINASGIGVSVFLGIVQDVGHEGPRIVDDGFNLDPVSYSTVFQPNTKELTP
jgi:hypothetical protein